MKKTMIAALLLLLTVGASAQECSVPVSGTASVMITRCLLPGEFSVSSTTKVRFTKGNLKYQASTNTWDFHENQIDCLDASEGNIAPGPTQSGWMDLFYWGTSGWSGTGTPGYQPWSCENENSAADYYGPPHPNNLTGAYAKADWGYNFSRNGNVFRILTNAEWRYLIGRGEKAANRRANSENLYGMGKVYGKPGCFILPDEWDWNEVDDGGTLRTAAGFSWVSENLDYTHNVIGTGDAGVALWTAMEAAGAVFLPCSGVRKGTSVAGGTVSARYWSSTSANATYAYIFYFQEEDEGAGKINVNYTVPKFRGRFVRLVQVLVP